ncbi:MAG: hypothetical protein ACR2HM_05140 [Acidimicrobiales bacterium]
MVLAGEGDLTGAEAEFRRAIAWAREGSASLAAGNLEAVLAHQGHIEVLIG